MLSAATHDYAYATEGIDLMLSNAKKLTAVTGAAVLTFGLAGPAFATGSTGSDGTPTHVTQNAAPTFAEVQAWIVKRIDQRLAWIAAAQTRVAASTVLTAQQKSDAATRLTARTTALLALKTAVAAATTKAALETAVKAFELSGGKLFWVHRHGHGHAQLAAWMHAHQAAAKKCDPAKKAPVAKAVAARHQVKKPTSSSSHVRSVTSTSLGDRTWIRTLSGGHRTMGQGSGSHAGHGSTGHGSSHH